MEKTRPSHELYDSLTIIFDELPVFSRIIAYGNGTTITTIQRLRINPVFKHIQRSILSENPSNEKTELPVTAMTAFSISFFLMLMISMMLSADVADIEPAIVSENRMTNNTTLEQQLTIPTQKINKMTHGDTDDGGLMGFLRRNLVGSNCVLITRGVATPYYTCIGCDIELAIGCINDMRTNASFNVAPGCLFSYNQEYYSQGGGHDDYTAAGTTTSTRKYHLNPCCPNLITMNTGVKNLQYIGT